MFEGFWELVVVAVGGWTIVALGMGIGKWYAIGKQNGSWGGDEKVIGSIVLLGLVFVVGYDLPSTYLVDCTDLRQNSDFYRDCLAGNRDVHLGHVLGLLAVVLVSIWSGYRRSVRGALGVEAPGVDAGAAQAPR